MLLPELTQRYPTIADGVQTDSRPLIQIDWSIDIDTSQFTEPVQLPKYVVLQQTDTNAVIPLVYVEYIAGLKRVVLQPSVDLQRGSNFRVIVNRLVKDSFGRKSDQQYLWDFQTDTASILKPSNLAPSNFIVSTSFPTFSWSETATGVQYQFIMAPDPGLAAPIVNNIISTTSYLPVGVFPYQTTYYWKVRAFTSSATGAWSDTYSFYFGTVDSANPSSSITYGDIDSFQISNTLFKNGGSLLSEFPNITIVFSSPPSTGFENYITFQKLDQVPRNDRPASFAYTPVSGSWLQNGNSITFTPGESITTNTRYDIVIDKDLLGQNGLPLKTEARFYFSAMYDPFYVHPRILRMRLGEAEQHIPDDMLNFMIYNASLDAKARYYGYLSLPVNGQMLGDLLKESYVRDSKDLNSYGALRWVEANVVYNVIKLVHMESLRKVGLSRTLEGYSESLGEAYVKNLELALRLAAEEIGKWYNYLIPSDIPSVVVRGSDYPVQAIRDWDMSISVEAHRGDGFGGNYGDW